jgi:hypothetical protein
MENFATMDDKAVLTIYTDGYDSSENVFGGGMSGKTFLDNLPGGTGKPFNSIDKALQYAKENKVEIGRIDFNYVGGDSYQSFWKFKVQKW